MKRILFIKPYKNRDTVDDNDWNGIEKALSHENSGQFSVSISDFNDLIYVADGKKSRIFHAVDNYDISEFDLVVIRRVGDEMEKAICIAQYLNSKKIPFTDTYLLTQGKGKLAGAFLRSAANIPAPRTIWCAPSHLTRIVDLLSYPIIVKADNGRKGKDNYLVTKEEQLKSILNKDPQTAFVIQPFIPNDGDFRILVLNKIPSLVISRKGVEGSHLNNTSQGGKAVIVPVEDLSDEVRNISIKAAESEKLQVAGVDIIVDKQTGKNYVLEVNRAPQLATGAFVAEKLSVYSKMVAELAGRGSSSHTLPILGSVETIELINEGVALQARIDTGAKTSSVWASDINIIDGELQYKVLAPEHPDYSGRLYTTKEFQETVVASSNGIAEKRYKVKLSIKVAGRNIKGAFTLADRSAQVYPVLIGRNLLKGKFVVDVRAGQPLMYDEKKRTKQLRNQAHEDQL